MYCYNNYGPLVKVEAISNTDISFKHPFQKYVKVLQAEDVILKAYPENAIELYSDDMSATYKDDYNNALPTSKHTISISYDMQNSAQRIREEESQIKSLRNGFYHLLLTFFGGNQAVVRCGDEQCFSFSESQEEGATKCNIVIQNICGIQFVQK